MEQIKNKLENYKIKKKEKKFKNEWNEFAALVAEHYEVPFRKTIWLFYRFPMSIIKEAFFYCEKRDQNFGSFVKRTYYMGKKGEVA